MRVFEVNINGTSRYLFNGEDIEYALKQARKFAARTFTGFPRITSITDMGELEK